MNHSHKMRLANGCLRNIDVFGSPINITYQRRSTYQTALGAIATILSYSFIVAYLSSRLVDFAKNYEQDENVLKVQTDLYAGGPVNLQDNHFGFSLFGHLPEGESDMAPYGRWVAKLISDVDVVNDTWTEQELELGDC